MDNKPTEKLGESYIKSRLLKFDFDIHGDLSYDKKGADLMITRRVDSATLNYIKVQCKSRKISKSTSVVIPLDYVDKNFVLFIYLIDEHKNEHLICFFEADFTIFKKGSENYSLNITKAKINTTLQTYLFDNIKAAKLKALFKQLREKKFTSIIIDGIFLKEAIIKTKNYYSSLWNKEYETPKLHIIIKHISRWFNRFSSENEISCNVYISNHHPLEECLIIDNKQNSLFLPNQTSIQISTTYSNSIIAFQIMENINRYKSANNIILIANDLVYEGFLRELENEVEEIIIARLKINERSNEMYVRYRWQDIAYPIGESLGINRADL